MDKQAITDALVSGQGPYLGNHSGSCRGLAGVGLFGNE